MVVSVGIVGAMKAFDSRASGSPVADHTSQREARAESGQARAVALLGSNDGNWGSTLSGSLLTADEVGELLGVPKSWVYEQSRRGRIPTVTLGRYRRYRREAIEAWLVELEAGEPRAPRRTGATPFGHDVTLGP